MIRLVSWAAMALALMIVAALMAALVWFVNEWILGTLATVAVLAWLAGWLVIAYSQGRVRAAAIGAVTAGAMYWLLALGPWFQLNVGSTLLTSRLLNWIEVNHRQQLAPPQPTSVFTTLDLSSSSYTTTNTLVNVNGLITTTPQYVVTTSPAPPPPNPSGMTQFQSAGHWSLTWLFALAGGMLAAFLHRRTATRQVPAKEQAS